MKNVSLAVFFSVICFTFFVGCPHQPQHGTITVENASDFDVVDISLTYQNGQRENSRQVSRIDIIQTGKSQTISVITQYGIGGLNVTDVVIEYFIDGKKYDVKYEKDAPVDNNGNAYTYAQLSAGGSTKFIIKNEYYMVENIW